MITVLKVSVQKCLSAFSKRVEEDAVGFHEFAHTVFLGETDVNSMLSDCLADGEACACEHHQ